MHLNNFTIKSQEAVQRAQQLALANENPGIELGHLLQGVLEVDENVTPFVLKKLGVNVDVVNKAVASHVLSYPKQTGGGGQLFLSRTANEAIQRANNYLKTFEDEYVALEHLLLGILAVQDSASQLLRDSGVTEKGLIAAIQELRKGQRVTTNSA
ncbi:MAG: Clp protease N-terminal domain-containing protein, partial [Bacteroidota bacterium]